MEIIHTKNLCDECAFSMRCDFDWLEWFSFGRWSSILFISISWHWWSFIFLTAWYFGCCCFFYFFFWFACFIWLLDAFAACQTMGGIHISVSIAYNRQMIMHGWTRPVNNMISHDIYERFDWTVCDHFSCCHACEWKTISYQSMFGASSYDIARRGWKKDTNILHTTVNMKWNHPHRLYRYLLFFFV